MTDTSDGPGRERFVSWKRIAQYLECSERTARRWAAEDGLPIHRHTPAAQSSVFAYRSELDAWLKNRPVPENGGDNSGRPVAGSGNGSAGIAGPVHGTPGRERASRPIPFLSTGYWRRAAFSRLALISGAILAALGFGSISALQSCGPVTDSASSLAFGHIEIEPFRVISGSGEQPALDAPIESLRTNILDALSTVGIRISAPEADEKAPTAEFSLVGVVQPEGDRTRITMRLSHRRTGAALWSRTFVRPAADVSGMRDHVTSLTTRVLACGFNLRDERTDLPPGMLADYLRYCTVIRDPTRLGGMKQLTEQLFRAHPHDPTAMAIHALELSGGRPHEREQALVLVKRILEKDPENPVARSIPVLMLPRWKNWAKVEHLILGQLPRDELSKRTSISNRWGIEVPYGFFLRRVGRLREAAGLYRRGIDANPYEIYARADLATLLREFGEYDIAETHFDRLEREQPDWPLVHLRRLQIDLFYRDVRAALARLNSDPKLRRYLSAARRNCYSAFARARINDTAQALRAVETACARFDARTRLFAILGDLDRAYAAADELAPSQVWATELFFYRGMRNFRRDPRFFALAARFGLVDYWLETGKWPDFCREKDLPFDCRERAMVVRHAGKGMD